MNIQYKKVNFFFFIYIFCSMLYKVSSVFTQHDGCGE